MYTIGSHNNNLLTTKETQRYLIVKLLKHVAKRRTGADASLISLSFLF